MKKFRSGNYTRNWLTSPARPESFIPAEQRAGATLLLDEFGSPKQLSGELRRILKARSIPHHFKQIVAKRSRSEALIQVADLAAGALHRRMVRGDEECYQLIRERFQAVAEFSEE